MTLKSTLLAGISLLFLCVFTTITVFAAGIQTPQTDTLFQDVSVQSTATSGASIPGVEGTSSVQIASSNTVTPLASGISLNDRVYVSYSANVNIRTAACGSAIQSIAPNTQGTVTGGLVECAWGGTNLTWWEVQWDNGVKAWVAQQVYENNSPVNLISRVSYPYSVDDYVASTAGGSGLAVRETACEGNEIRRVPANTVGKIVDSTPAAVLNCFLGDYLYWWQIEWYDESNNVIATGWSSEDFLTASEAPEEPEPKAPDTNPPFVSIQHANAGNLYFLSTENPEINVHASDGETHILNVELYLNDTYLANDETSEDGWVFALDTLSVGTHTIQARAVDAAKNSALSPVITMHIIDIDSPDYQTTISGDVEGQKYEVTIDYFENAEAVHAHGNVDMLTSCTQNMTGSIALEDGGYVIAVSAGVVYSDDHLCTMGTHTLEFAELTSLSLDSDDLAVYNTLFSFDEESLLEGEE